MGWTKKDPLSGVDVLIDDDLTEEQAGQALAADADGAKRLTKEEVLGR